MKSPKIMPQGTIANDFERTPDGLIAYSFTFRTSTGAQIAVMAASLDELTEYATELLKRKGVIPDVKRFQKVVIRPAK